MHRPTIVLDATDDLAQAGYLRTDAAIDSFRAAFHRAARIAGVRVVNGSYDGPRPADADDDGLTEDQIHEVWQLCHDAIRESRPGRWGVSMKRDDIRRRAREIMGE
jgi:hypothetical protein